MKKMLIMLLFFFNLVSLSYAYTLNGTMTDNNDGTYAILLNSADDKVYNGIGVMQGDGTLTIDVAIEDEGSETYICLGTPNHDGSYALSLRNNTSGEIATGNLTED